MTDERVIVYTATGCSSCEAAMRFLEDNEVDYLERNVSVDEAAAKEMEEYGAMQTPLILVGGHVISGFDRTRLSKALGLR